MQKYIKEVGSLGPIVRFLIRNYVVSSGVVITKRDMKPDVNGVQMMRGRRFMNPEADLDQQS